MGAHAVSLGERLLRPRRARTFLHRLSDGLATTVHVATWPRRTTRVRVAALEPAQPLRAWARRTGVADALVGGFHVDPAVSPLGELWVGGEAHMCVPFDAPRDDSAPCIAIDGDRVEIAARAVLPSRPDGDLLQAGPLLVVAGKPIAGDRHGAERHPRTAFGIGRDRFVAAVCDGHSLRDAGMTLGELAGLMAELGVETAINLAGGGSASLVCGGRLQNRPRDDNGVALLGGRPVASALVFGR